MLRQAAVALLVSTLAAIVAASPRAAEPAQGDGGQSGTEVHLVQRAERVLPHDRIHVDLRAEAKGPDPRQVQADVNRRMAAALQLVKGNGAVTGESGSYTVFQDYEPKGAGQWHASQALSLSGRDFGAVLEVAGQLQSAGLVMSGMRFDLAPDTLKSAEDELTATALDGLRQRAERIAAEMGMRIERYKELDVGNVSEQDGRPPVPMRAMASASAAMPPPVAEGGEATISLVISAQVVLQPRH